MSSSHIHRALAGALLGTLVIAASGAAGGVTHARGADAINGEGTRLSTEFEFHVVVVPTGRAIGRFNSTLMSNIGLPFQGDVRCGRVAGNIGVFGGVIDGADPAPASSWFTVVVSDGPDGIIIGNGQPDCGTGGFGSPGSLTITSGEIVVIDR